MRLLMNRTLFIERVNTKEEAIEFLMSMNQDENPLNRLLGEMLTKSGKLKLTPNLTVPFRKLFLETLIFENMVIEEKGQRIEGIGIGLPKDVVRLYTAFETSLKGFRYNWDIFLFQYANDLKEQGALLFKHLDAMKTDGMMAQVITNPKIGKNEVGLSKWTAHRLLKSLQKTHPELEITTYLSGMKVLLQRYPVAFPKGSRWVLLRILKDAPDDKILVNAQTWKEFAGGDEDGDLGYLSVGETIEFSDLEEVGIYPNITIMSGSNPLNDLIEELK